MQFEYETLSLNHLPQLKKFKCGNLSMDGFIINEAYNHQINGEGITTVITETESNEIIAYYTLKCDSLKIVDPEMFDEPKYIPSIEVARLAVCRSWQNGRKDNLHLGTELMKYIITIIKEEISSKVGCRFITLHALKDKVDWYSKEFCFESLVDDKTENPDEDTQYMCLDITENAQRDEYYEYLKTT